MVQSEVPFLLEVPHFRLQLSWFELGNCIPIHCPGIDLRQQIPDALPLLVREPNHSTLLSDRQQSAILR
jgi:hypothetical protein